MKNGNLLRDIPPDLQEEFTESLSEGEGKFRIERIISQGQSSPSDFWYDQDGKEWVALLSGSAVVRFGDPEEMIKLQPGDWIEIPAHRKHRVESTSKSEDTIWLAVHSIP